ncbi:hypothetical protein EMCRGX_G012243 [Ephydatia muelleri]
MSTKVSHEHQGPPSVPVIINATFLSDSLLLLYLSEHCIHPSPRKHKCGVTHDACRNHCNSRKIQMVKLFRVLEPLCPSIVLQVRCLGDLHATLCLWS